MKHKLLVPILILQTLVVCVFIFFAIYRVSSGTTLTIKTTATRKNLNYYQHEIFLDFYDIQNIPMSEELRSNLNDKSYWAAYVVFKATKNREGYNDIAYVTLDEPTDTPLYISCSISDTDESYNEIEKTHNIHLDIYNSLDYKLSEQKVDSLRDALPFEDDSQVLYKVGEELVLGGANLDAAQEKINTQKTEISATIVVDKGLVLIDHIYFNGVKY